jgi:hypothetical protein
VWTLVQQINYSSDIVYCNSGTTDQLLLIYCIFYIWHHRSTTHQILYIVYLAQQINCSSDTVYFIFGTTDQLFIRYCIFYIWQNRSTVHQILRIVYLAQQNNCSSDTVYCIFGTTDKLLIRYCVSYTEWPKKMYTLFTHQYLWNKFKWNFYFRVSV